MSALVGEPEGLDEKKVFGRRLLSRLPGGALSGGSLMGVKAEMSGRKIVKDFLLRLSDIVPNVHSIQSRSLFADCTIGDLQRQSGDLGDGCNNWRSGYASILERGQNGVYTA